MRVAPVEAHLALITMDFAPQIGGVQEYLFEITRRLALRCRVTVVTPVEGLPAGSPAFARRRVSSNNTLAYWRALRDLRPTHIIVGHAHPQLLVAAALAARGSYAAIAYGNDYLAAQRRRHRPLFNYLLRRARPLLTITAFNVRRLQELGIPGARPALPGTDPTRFMPAAEEPAGPPVLLSVCRLVPRKGLDTVIEALPALLSDFPELVYRIVGDGPDRPRLEALAAEKGVAGQVHFVGRVSSMELPACYRGGHIFVLPAREGPGTASVEGFGIVFLEAAASGLPVVAGRSGGVAEALLPGETGLLVPPADARLLAEALRGLLNDPARRRQMGQAGRAWVEREMSWDHAARRFAAALAVDCA